MITLAIYNTFKRIIIIHLNGILLEIICWNKTWLIRKILFKCYMYTDRVAYRRQSPKFANTR